MVAAVSTVLTVYCVSGSLCWRLTLCTISTDFGLYFDRLACISILLSAHCLVNVVLNISHFDKAAACLVLSLGIHALFLLLLPYSVVCPCVPV